MVVIEEVGRVKRNLDLYQDVGDYQIADDPLAYTEEEKWQKGIEWELECALISRDWSRVRSALLMIAGKPKKKRGRPRIRK